jgi:hypothetical protein
MNFYGAIYSYMEINKVRLINLFGAIILMGGAASFFNDPMNCKV